MVARHHFDCLAADFLEIGDQAVQIGPAQIVATGMGKHRDSATGADPADCIGKIGPAVLHIARLALDQVFFEHGTGILDDALCHQKAGKVGAADDAGIGGIGVSAFQAAQDADFFQLGGDAHGAFAAAGTNRRQTVS